MGKKVMIVFEESGSVAEDSKGRPGVGFNVYLDGELVNVKKYIANEIKSDDLTASEFWGYRMFGIVAKIMKDCGALQKEPTVKQ